MPDDLLHNAPSPQANTLAQAPLTVRDATTPIPEPSLKSPQYEARQAALRQVLAQKWASIEHYDEMDQRFLLSSFVLVGAAAALVVKFGTDTPQGDASQASQGDGSQVSQKHNCELPVAVSTLAWLALFLLFAALVGVFRSFAAYYRNHGVIERVEHELGIQDVIDERSCMTGPDSKIPSTRQGVSFWRVLGRGVGKILLTWRLGLLLIYGALAVVALRPLAGPHVWPVLGTCLSIVVMFLLLFVWPIWRDEIRRLKDRKTASTPTRAKREHTNAQTDARREMPVSPSAASSAPQSPQKPVAPKKHKRSDR